MRLNYYAHAHGRVVDDVAFSLPTLEGNWAEVAFSKTSWIVTGDRGKKWPIADGHVCSNYRRRLCEG